MLSGISRDLPSTLVLAAWLVFWVVFLWQKRANRARSASRAPRAYTGIVLHGAAFALVFGVLRAPGTPILPLGPVAALALDAVWVALAWSSIALMLWAIRRMGRQWAVAARIVARHELITTGPFRVVRNPIYTGLFGAMIATGGVLARPAALLAAIPLFLLGTLIRVREEQALLRAEFGAAYDEYTRRVPALVPRPWR
ncbi:MAG TPA: isoprenylcysteine carboxylmethyltransferase family protein [Vicinamibacterales bacterium]|nr:isoprenylcysteine carboxylmethyltransferase family protein [Vicinamibacterales bacterium]